MPFLSLPVLRLTLVAGIVIGLAACSRPVAYRYKLTLAVDTPEGVKRATNVVEVAFFRLWFPERGTTHKLRGEALYLDMGPKKRPLIALLTSTLHTKYNKDERWTPDGGPSSNLFASLFGLALQDDDVLSYASRIARMRGQRLIEPTDLPDLVTFTDVDDPKSILEVNPGNLEAVLGAGMKWHEIALEITDEPVTVALATKLPWLPRYSKENLNLDGSAFTSKNELSNLLSTFNFTQSIN